MAFAHHRNVEVSMMNVRSWDCIQGGAATSGCLSATRVKTGWTRTDTGTQLPACRAAATTEGRPSLRVHSVPSPICSLDTQKGGLHTRPSQDTPYHRLGVSGGLVTRPAHPWVLLPSTHANFLPQADGGQDAPHSFPTSDLPDQGFCRLVFKGPLSRL